MRHSTTVVVLTVFGRSLGAQVPRDTVAVLDSVAKVVIAIGARHGDAVWPGYRPDTIPIAFVLPGRGTLLVNWRGALPEKFAAVDGMPAAGWRNEGALGAASNAMTIGGRRVAQVALASGAPIDPAAILATAFHEAFHVFERASAKSTGRFGNGENSAMIGSYPEFDVENETAFELEGRILSAALSTDSPKQRRALAREFVAVRRGRHHRLSGEFANFDQMSEMNEGLAEYALERALQFLAVEGPPEWRATAVKQAAANRQMLADLTADRRLSSRIRYYRTGSAIALLLDRLTDQSWKRHLVEENLALQDLLASVSGLDAPSERARKAARKEFGAAGLRQQAAQRIERRQASRMARVDTIMSAPGIRLVLRADSLPSRQFNSCGVDPQNILQITPALRIHSRWWRPCSGGPTYAEFNTPSIQDDSTGTIRAVIGDDSAIHMTSGGEPITLRDGDTLRNLKAFKLEAPRASVDAVRADVERRGNTLTLYPKAQ